MLLPQGAKLKILGTDQITLKLCIPSFKVLHSSKDLNFLSPKLWGTNVHLYPPMGGADNSTAWDFFIWESTLMLKDSVAQNELP